MFLVTRSSSATVQLTRAEVKAKGADDLLASARTDREADVLGIQAVRREHRCTADGTRRTTRLRCAAANARIRPRLAQQPNILPDRGSRRARDDQVGAHPGAAT